MTREEYSSLKDQLSTLDEATKFILLTIAGVTLSYFGVLIQRGQLTGAAAGTEPPGAGQLFGVQTVSSVLVLAAVLYFFFLSARALETPAGSPGAEKLGHLNFLSNGLVLAAAMIRFYNLFFARAIAPSESAGAAEMQELENSFAV